jgi:hypothetical protein
MTTKWQTVCTTIDTLSNSGSMYCSPTPEWLEQDGSPIPEDEHVPSKVEQDAIAEFNAKYPNAEKDEAEYEAMQNEWIASWEDTHSAQR